MLASSSSWQPCLLDCVRTLGRTHSDELQVPAGALVLVGAALLAVLAFGVAMILIHVRESHEIIVTRRYVPQARGVCRHTTDQWSKCNCAKSDPINLVGAQKCSTYPLMASTPILIVAPLAIEMLSCRV